MNEKSLALLVVTMHWTSTATYIYIEQC